MKNFDRIAQVLANLTPEEAMHVIAKSQVLRNTPEPKSCQVPEAKVQELKERYENLAAIKQRKIPINISGHLVLNLALQDTYHIESVKLESDLENEAVTLINEILEDNISLYCADSAIEDLQEKASDLVEEMETLADEYDDPELFEKVQNSANYNSRPHRYRRARKKL